MTQEQLQSSVKTLLSIDHGMSNCYNDAPDYYEGFLYAVHMWTAGGTPREGFRHVVESKQEYLDSESDEFMRGFDKALRMFQEAKTL